MTDILEMVYQMFGQRYDYPNVKKYPELDLVTVIDDSGIMWKIEVSRK